MAASDDRSTVLIGVPLFFPSSVFQILDSYYKSLRKTGSMSCSSGTSGAAMQCHVRPPKVIPCDKCKNRSDKITRLSAIRGQYQDGD